MEFTRWQMFDLLNRGEQLWLVRADLSGADLSKAILSKAKFTVDTRWSAGFNPEAAGAVLG